MAYRLICVLGAKKGQKIVLEGDRVFTLGRSSTADLAVDDHKMSRIHCQVEVAGGKCSVSDLNSTNGTFVNGRRIREKALEHGDHLAVGTTSFMVERDPPPPATEGKGEMRFCSLCKGSVLQKELNAGRASWLGEHLFCVECIQKGMVEKTLEAVSGRVQEVRAKTEKKEEKPKEPLKPGKVIGGYSIKKKIGEGVLGTVYMAEQLTMHRTVALKVLSEKATGDTIWLNNFLKQAHLAGQLVHPNILLVYDIGNAEGMYYISMEYVEGVPVATLIEQQKGLPVRKALAVTTQVAQAMEHAFEHKIPHKDIRPQNILMDDSGIAKLCGFGTSCLLSKSPPKTLPKEELPTTIFAYQPPEFFDASAELDFRSDIYSLGASFYHMLSGRSPFVAESVSDLRRSIQQGTYKRLPDLASGFPESLCHIVQKAMERDVEKRYKVPRELLLDLERASKELR